MAENAPEPPGIGGRPRREPPSDGRGGKLELSEGRRSHDAPRAVTVLGIMTKITLSSLGLVLALIAAACSGSDNHADIGAAEESPGSTVVVVNREAAPISEFGMFDGSSSTFADYGGQPLVVNFWASWCPSCVAEMAAAFRPAQENLGDEIAFLGLNIQDERDDALRLVEETGVLFDLGDDSLGDLYLEFGGIGMPFTIFIDADGFIVERHNGPLTEAQLLDMIEEAFSS